MDKKTLRFNSEGEFRILMVSDFHERCSTGKKLLTHRLVEGLEALLAHTNPDLVLIGGDQCLNAKTFDEMKEHMEYIISPIIKRGLPWAAIFGNHDSEWGHTLEEEQAVYETIPGCLSEAGPEEVSGVGNYCLEILSSKDDSVAYHVWGLDSHAESRRDFVESFNLPADTRFVMPHPLYNGSWQGGVFPDQVMWYYNESLRRERAAGKKIPAIMYMHIPLPELCLVEWNPEQTDARDIRREDVSCPELNSGMFMTCLQRGDVKGIFFGHEHLNNFAGKYCGITLGYDGCLGYNMSTHDELRGGRVIDLTEDGGMTTYNVTLMDIMGQKALRDPSWLEGGQNYNFRTLPLK